MKTAFVLVLAFLAAAPCVSAAERRAAMAGSFYPADAAELAAAVDGHLASAPAPAADSPRPRALVAPHAGYVYSGKTAGRAFRLLEGHAYDTVVLVGPYHRGPLPGVSVWTGDAWNTPLGRVEIDAEAARALAAADPSFGSAPEFHAAEHSLEVELPFLQRVLKKPFKIVPVLLQDASPETSRALGAALREIVETRDALVVVSTDMTHYVPQKEAAERDRQTLLSLAKGDAPGLRRRLARGDGELCGAGAALAWLDAAPALGSRGKAVAYSTSADASGDRSSVVGYGAAAFYDAGIPPPARRKILDLARRTLEAELLGASAPPAGDAALPRSAGVFVTLRRAGALRGCVGTFAEAPLGEAVPAMARAAAFEDGRFPPLEAAELADLGIHVSVLGTRSRVPGPESIVLGRHGVIVERDGRSGVFLPEVARETGWPKERFLSELCSQKAGLPRDAWKEPQTRLYVFETEEFGE